MAGKIKFVVTGMDELQREMRQLLEEMRDAAGEGITACAEKTADIVRSVAPVGPTGNLKKAVAIKKLPNKWGYPVTVMVGLDYQIAPHQHIVEFGAGPRHHKSGKSVGSMPANGFFRYAIDLAGFEVEVIRQRCARPIKKRGG